MNLHDLETFVSIAQLGGVTRAAGQLHRSQPAITRRIKILEHQLGVPLLERGRNGALLTDAGRSFGVDSWIVPRLEASHHPIARLIRWLV